MQQQLRVYSEVFDICYDRYTGVTRAPLFIRKTMKTARVLPNSGSLQTAINLKDTVPKFSPVASLDSNWFVMFVSQPNLYLRIALTIDMSLSIGCSPSADELPRQLQIQEPEEVQGCMPYISTPATSFYDASHIVPRQPDKADTVKTQHTNLDYFELSDRSSDSQDEALWDGHSFDDMLENFLNGSLFIESWDRDREWI